MITGYKNLLIPLLSLLELNSLHCRLMLMGQELDHKNNYMGWNMFGGKNQRPILQIQYLVQCMHNGKWQKIYESSMSRTNLYNDSTSLRAQENLMTFCILPAPHASLVNDLNLFEVITKPHNKQILI